MTTISANMTAINISKSAAAKAFLFALLVTAIYYSALKVLVNGWGGDYSYCYLVPILIIYILWEKRDRLNAEPSFYSWAGFAPFFASIFLFWVGELGGEYFTLYLSFWLALVGLFWIHVGWPKTKTAFFAFFLILTTFKLPNFLYNKLSVKLQLISSELGVLLLRIYGESAYREGNVIDLGFTQLHVVDACSGLRYVIPLAVMALIISYFARGSLLKKAVLVFSSVPLAIFVNSLRIALTGVLYREFGAAAAEGFFHDFSGWLIFMVSLGLLLIELLILSGFSMVKAIKRPEATPIEISQNKLPRPQSKLFPAQTALAVVILTLTLFFSHVFDFRERVPILKSLSYFPHTIGSWEGTSERLDSKIIDRLDLNDYTVIDFQDATGKKINFYVAYYESQRKGESIHSPATCLPGSGWIFKEAGAKELPIVNAKGQQITANRAFMQKLNDNRLSYYWFPQRGRTLTNAYQLKLYAFWDALTKQRTDGALVRLITPIYQSETLEDTEARLTKFTKQIWPILDEFIPGKDVS